MFHHTHMGKRKVIETVETFEDPWDKLDEPVVYPEPAPCDPDEGGSFREGEDGWFYTVPSVNSMKRSAAACTLQAFIRTMNPKSLDTPLPSEHGMFRKM